ncbi:MAG TPA: beta-N-acetylhexosaminidase [Polyangiales bacterium]|nr:beta-N-acetylhexosaminidase [Polyangiales bacterium]
MPNLSTNQSAGQLLVVGFPAGDPPSDLMELSGRGELGGFILFRRNLGTPAEVARLTSLLHESSPADFPPFVGVDQEGGRVARLGSPVLRLPPMRVLGDLDDVALTERCAVLLGRQLRILGFNLDFAPVLDVDTNPANPVIGDRSFGREPARVIAHARAFARGLASAHVIACGKHFPGHGDTLEDSHLALPRVQHALERLRAVELVPFAALAQELPTLMTAHVVFDAIDPALPATLSRAAIDGLLRQQLGYTGLVWSDDLEMKAISERYGIGDAAVRAIEAGCDAVLVCAEPKHALEAHAALCERAARDAAFAARVRASAEKSLALRLAHRVLPRHPTAVAAELVAEQPERIEQEIASRTASGG